MRRKELMTILFQYFFSIDSKFNEFLESEEVYYILLEKALSDQQDNTIISLIFENLRTKDYFKNYQIEKLIMLNTIISHQNEKINKNEKLIMPNKNVWDYIDIIIVNQLDIEKKDKLMKIIINIKNFKAFKQEIVLFYEFVCYLKISEITFTKEFNDKLVIRVLIL